MIIYVNVNKLRLLLVGADGYLKYLHSDTDIPVDTSLLVNLGGLASHCPEESLRRQAEAALRKMQGIDE